MEDLLEIFIFTYNRAQSLRRTLAQFGVEPIRRFRLTVLDNHSTDATADVCAEAAKFHPNLIVVRHPKNIGGLANYLRAIELAKAKYTWVICDDDSYDFSKFGDILAELERGEADIVSVGVTGHALTPGTRSRLYDYSLQETLFLSHSFVPSMIFRTSLFDPDCIRAGYDNIDTMFPHFPFMIRVAEANCSIYVSREKVIIKSNNVGYSTFRFMTGWIKSCRRISSATLREKVQGEVFSGDNFRKTLVFSLLTERQFRPTKFRAEFRDLCAEAARTDRIVWLQLMFFWPFLLLPEFVHRALWRKYSDYRKNRGSELPNFDESR